MLNDNKINRLFKPQAAAVERSRPRRLAAGRPIGFWPRLLAGRFRPFAWMAAAGVPIFLAGCGGATAPCPTPTSEIDRLRTESERLQADLDRAAARERELRSARDAASLKLGSAQAALDSLLGEEPR